MSNPLERLKRLPWVPLFHAALLTAIAAVVVEFILALGAQFPEFRALLLMLVQPPLALFTMLAISFGIGVLAVVFLEYLNRVAINTSNLWAFILCLAIVFLILGLLPVFPIGLFQIGYTQLVVMALGVFFKGRRYWRW